MPQIIGIIGVLILMGAIIDFILLRKRQAAEIENLGKRIQKSSELFSEYSQNAEKVLTEAGALIDEYHTKNELLQKRLVNVNERLKLLLRLNANFMEQANIVIDFLNKDEMSTSQAKAELRSYVSMMNSDISTLNDTYALLSEQEVQDNEQER